MNIASQSESMPPPPAGKRGWPWISDRRPVRGDDERFPRISIVTPSFNQGMFIEETIRSILLQGYPNLEYIVLDGGSSDDTVSILEKYSPWISYWRSEKDGGQSSAINSGFSMASGDICTWINSDDLLMPGALHHVAHQFQQSPEMLIVGDAIYLWQETGTEQLYRSFGITFERLLDVWNGKMHWTQPATFIPMAEACKVGFLDESLRYTFDYDWMLRLTRILQVQYISEPLAKFRFHNESKTVDEFEKWLPEVMKVCERYSGESASSYDREPYFRLRFEVMPLLSPVRGQYQRMKGLQRLYKLVGEYPPILLQYLFWMTLGAAVLPVSISRLVRKFIQI